MDIKLDKSILNEMEELLDREVVFKGQYGKEIYNIWIPAEKRRICRFYLGDKNLEEVVSETLEKHNQYYQTTYERKDVSVICEREDDTIQLAKANWRIDCLLKTICRMEQEIVQTKWNLKEANQRLSKVSPTVMKGAHEIAKEVLEKVDKLHREKHFMSPNESLTQLTERDKQSILNCYCAPDEVTISVETEYAPECCAKSI